MECQTGCGQTGDSGPSLTSHARWLLPPLCGRLCAVPL